MRVVVVVEGGVVQDVILDGRDIEVAVMDFDVDGDEAPDVSPKGEPCCIALYERGTNAVDPDFVDKVFGTPEKKVPLRIRFGRPETGVPVDELEFSTKGERDAYLQGVAAATDWDDYEVLDGDESEEE
jgi:hypothetical protein